jgi:hypothetical protein
MMIFFHKLGSKRYKMKATEEILVSWLVLFKTDNMFTAGGASRNTR